MVKELLFVVKLILHSQNHVKIYERREKYVNNKCAKLLTPNARCNNIIIHSEPIQSSEEDITLRATYLKFFPNHSNMSWLASPDNFTTINMYLSLCQLRKVKFDECCEVTKWTPCKYSHFSTRRDKVNWFNSLLFSV